MEQQPQPTSEIDQRDNNNPRPRVEAFNGKVWTMGYEHGNPARFDYPEKAVKCGRHHVYYQPTAAFWFYRKDENGKGQTYYQDQKGVEHLITPGMMREFNLRRGTTPLCLERDLIVYGDEKCRKCYLPTFRHDEEVCKQRASVFAALGPLYTDAHNVFTKKECPSCKTEHIPWPHCGKCQMPKHGKYLSCQDMLFLMGMTTLTGEKNWSLGRKPHFDALEFNKDGICTNEDGYGSVSGDWLSDPDSNMGEWEQRMLEDFDLREVDQGKLISECYVKTDFERIKGFNGIKKSDQSQRMIRIDKGGQFHYDLFDGKDKPHKHVAPTYNAFRHFVHPMLRRSGSFDGFNYRPCLWSSNFISNYVLMLNEGYCYKNAFGISLQVWTWLRAIACQSKVKPSDRLEYQHSVLRCVAMLSKTACSYDWENYSMQYAFERISYSWFRSVESYDYVFKKYNEYRSEAQDLVPRDEEI